MDEAAEESLELQRARALDVYRPSGAIVVHEYLDRRQEMVAVNKNDLDDILGFDEMATIAIGAGMFFLSGATWLLIDKLTGMTEIAFTAAVAACSLSIVFGLISLAAGYYMHRRKRGRITRIFSETTPIKRP